MSVLTAIQKACAVIGLEIPVLVYGSTEREHIELQSLANDMAQRIAREHDWNKLKVIATIAGDGVTAFVAFPVNYQRMMSEGQLWSTARPNVPLTHITDSDIWLADSLSGEVPLNPQWTQIGSDLYVTPIIPTGETVSYFYIKTVDEFTADTDTFILSERLLTLAIIWQWKANKGLQYAEDMQTFEIELKQAIKYDMGASMLATGTDRYRVNSSFVTIKDLTP